MKSVLFSFLARYFFDKFWIGNHHVYVFILFISEVLSVHCHCRVRMSGFWNLRFWWLEILNKCLPKSWTLAEYTSAHWFPIDNCHDLTPDS